MSPTLYSTNCTKHNKVNIYYTGGQSPYWAPVLAVSGCWYLCWTGRIGALEELEE